MSEKNLNEGITTENSIASAGPVERVVMRRLLNTKNNASDSDDKFNSTGAMAAAWFGTSGTTDAIESVFGKA